LLTNNFVKRVTRRMSKPSRAKLNEARKQRNIMANVRRQYRRRRVVRSCVATLRMESEYVAKLVDSIDELKKHVELCEDIREPLYKKLLKSRRYTRETLDDAKEDFKEDVDESKELDLKCHTRNQIPALRKEIHYLQLDYWAYVGKYCLCPDKKRFMTETGSTPLRRCAAAGRYRSTARQWGDGEFMSSFWANEYYRQPTRGMRRYNRRGNLRCPAKDRCCSQYTIRFPRKRSRRGGHQGPDQSILGTFRVSGAETFSGRPVYQKFLRIKNRATGKITTHRRVLFYVSEDEAVDESEKAAARKSSTAGWRIADSTDSETFYAQAIGDRDRTDLCPSDVKRWTVTDRWSKSDKFKTDYNEIGSSEDLACAEKLGVAEAFFYKARGGPAFVRPHRACAGNKGAARYCERRFRTANKMYNKYCGPSRALPGVCSNWKKDRQAADEVKTFWNWCSDDDTNPLNRNVAVSRCFDPAVRRQRIGTPMELTSPFGVTGRRSLFRYRTWMTQADAVALGLNMNRGGLRRRVIWLSRANGRFPQPFRIRNSYKITRLSNDPDGAEPLLEIWIGRSLHYRGTKYYRNRRRSYKYRAGDMIHFRRPRVRGRGRNRVIPGLTDRIAKSEIEPAICASQNGRGGYGTTCECAGGVATFGVMHAGYDSTVNFPGEYATGYDVSSRAPGRGDILSFVDMKAAKVQAFNPRNTPGARAWVSKQVSSSIECSTGEDGFGTNPIFGYHKVCWCVPPSN
jgi:hypothetical protein